MTDFKALLRALADFEALAELEAILEERRGGDHDQIA
jgi:hypothetical protein